MNPSNDQDKDCQAKGADCPASIGPPSVLFGSTLCPESSLGQTPSRHPAGTAYPGALVDAAHTSELRNRVPEPDAQACPATDARSSPVGIFDELLSGDTLVAMVAPSENRVEAQSGPTLPASSTPEEPPSPLPPVPSPTEPGIFETYRDSRGELRTKPMKLPPREDKKKRT
ncbi:hypothetical protein GQ53DRAFT_834620 [Thozetella sp. PMI_491]|nr:hypothetical protein GQ53DRAFT_834620 [Thozetella sp. PMI_491]